MKQANCYHHQGVTLDGKAPPAEDEFAQ